MAKQLTEDELREQAVKVLTEKLGPVDSFRFIASVSREPFDYQQWRKKYFSHYGIDELLEEIEKQHGARTS